MSFRDASICQNSDVNSGTQGPYRAAWARGEAVAESWDGDPKVPLLSYPCEVFHNSTFYKKWWHARYLESQLKHSGEGAMRCPPPASYRVLLISELEL